MPFFSCTHAHKYLAMKRNHYSRSLT